MKEYKAKLKPDMCEAMICIIDHVITHSVVAGDDDETKMYLAALEEVKIRLAKKLIVYRQQYLTTFSPVQALSMRMLYADYCALQKKFINPYTQNKLRMIADEVHKHYS